MSVLECNRSGCENIMCDRLSHEHGYICGECFEELVMRGPTTNVKEFMESEKVYTYKSESEARFNVVFPFMD